MRERERKRERESEREREGGERVVVVTQAHVSCEQTDLPVSIKTGKNDKQKEQIRHELCKCMHTNTKEVPVGGERTDDGLLHK